MNISVDLDTLLWRLNKPLQTPSAMPTFNVTLLQYCHSFCVDTGLTACTLFSDNEGLCKNLLGSG
ncbi:MAG: hypothetical protein AAGC54_12340, partial [Cyanobacteria bacterium P01_F01_bin.4]